MASLGNTVIHYCIHLLHQGRQSQNLLRGAQRQGETQWTQGRPGEILMRYWAGWGGEGNHTEWSEKKQVAQRGSEISFFGDTQTEKQTEQPGLSETCLERRVVLGSLQIYTGENIDEPKKFKLEFTVTGIMNPSSFFQHIVEYQSCVTKSLKWDSL